jgi:SpoVK/Ycf46/Vps4 family AAA+-type ATPase
MSQPSLFDSETVLPDAGMAERAKGLLGFDKRYARVRDQLRLLLDAGALEAWNRKHHGGKLLLAGLVAEQYPLVIFHGDVGTGKTAMAECIANRLVAESGTSDSMLFKLSNRVRGKGMVGEMGSLLTEAMAKVTLSAGKSRRAILVIDESDSLGASRAHDHSHHEDKVAVNTLIQAIDDLRRYGGRVVVILCTNRLSVLDSALRRRAAIVEAFNRPTAEERRDLFTMDIADLPHTPTQLKKLVELTGARDLHPGWTYSDIRTRLYPAAVARAYPIRGLQFDDLLAVADELRGSPVMEDK